jgi:hypothetical protein
MQVMGATNGKPTGQWAAVTRSISHWRGTVLDINQETVANIGYVNTSKADYNYAAGAIGMFSGAMLFGPVGMAVGGLLPKGFKGSVVEFAIEMRDGTVLRAKGKPQEYEKLVKWSMESPDASFKARVNALAGTTDADLEKKASIQGLATDDDRERLRASIAQERAAKKSPEAKAERKARIKAVHAQKLSFRETMKLVSEIDAEYR